MPPMKRRSVRTGKASCAQLWPCFRRPRPVCADASFFRRVDAYFLQYRRELGARGARGGKHARFAQRLAAAQEEHLRRRNDQIHRHEISVTPHLDAILWIAEPAWRTHVRWTEGSETCEAPWNYVPRLRRWLPPAEAGYN